MRQLFNHPQSERSQRHVDLPFRELYAIMLKRVGHFDHTRDDPDAFCQQVCVEIEKAMGIFPNIPPLEPADWDTKELGPWTGGVTPHHGREAMSDIPDDIRATAEKTLDLMLCNCKEAGDVRADSIMDIAKAILAERERCAWIAEVAGDTWSGTRDSHQAVQEAAVDDKYIEIARLIRTPTEGR